MKCCMRFSLVVHYVEHYNTYTPLVDAFILTPPPCVDHSILSFFVCTSSNIVFVATPSSYPCTINLYESYAFKLSPPDSLGYQCPRSSAARTSYRVRSRCSIQESTRSSRFRTQLVFCSMDFMILAYSTAVSQGPRLPIRLIRASRVASTVCDHITTKPRRSFTFA